MYDRWKDIECPIIVGLDCRFHFRSRNTKILSCEGHVGVDSIEVLSIIGWIGLPFRWFCFVRVVSTFISVLVTPLRVAISVNRWYSRVLHCEQLFPFFFVCYNILIWLHLFVFIHVVFRCSLLGYMGDRHELVWKYHPVQKKTSSGTHRSKNATSPFIAPHSGRARQFWDDFWPRLPKPGWWRRSTLRDCAQRK